MEHAPVDGGRDGVVRGQGVLLVGLRGGAVRAAERLGVAPWALFERSPSAALAQRVPRRRQVDLSRREPFLRALRELCAGERPGAVVPVGEGAVTAAAWARTELGLPGNDRECARCCTDKIAMKRACAEHGVRCTAWRVVEPGAAPGELVRELGLPLVLKRPRTSGSRGLVLARDETSAAAALDERRLAERFVHGREMSVESFVLGGRVLFTNPTEYLVPLHANVLPAALPAEVLAAVLRLNERAVAAMGVERGMTHVELFLTPEGPVFGEIAARPPGGRIMALLQRAWGFDPWEALLRVELGEDPGLPEAPRRLAGVWILHPGAGRVRAVEGAADAQAVPGVRRLVVRVGAGDEIPPRLGSGQDVGFIEVEGARRDDVVVALERACSALRFRLGAEEPAG